MAITIATVDAQLLSAHPPSQLEVCQAGYDLLLFWGPTKNMLLLLLLLLLPMLTPQKGSKLKNIQIGTCTEVTKKNISAMISCDISGDPRFVLLMVQKSG